MSSKIGSELLYAHHKGLCVVLPRPVKAEQPSQHTATQAAGTQRLSPGKVDKAAELDDCCCSRRVESKRRGWHRRGMGGRCWGLQKVDELVLQSDDRSKRGM